MDVDASEAEVVDSAVSLLKGRVDVVRGLQGDGGDELVPVFGHQFRHLVVGHFGQFDSLFRSGESLEGWDGSDCQYLHDLGVRLHNAKPVIQVEEWGRVAKYLVVESGMVPAKGFRVLRRRDMRIGVDDDRIRTSHLASLPVYFAAILSQTRQMAMRLGIIWTTVALRFAIVVPDEILLRCLFPRSLR